MYIDKGLLDLLSDEAARQLRELPRQDAAGTFRRLVKKALGRQTPKKDDLFWPAGLLLLGLWEAGRRETVEAYVRAWMAKNAPVSYVDDALAGYVILCLDEQTKDPQFKEAADLIREFLEDTPKDQSGAIIYGPGRGSRHDSSVSVKVWKGVRKRRSCGAFEASDRQLFKLRHGLSVFAALPRI